jgi:hypothetical protein
MTKAEIRKIYLFILTINFAFSCAREPAIPEPRGIPRASNLGDKSFLAQIDRIGTWNDSNDFEMARDEDDEFITQLRATDFHPSIAKDEYETTEQFNARLAAQPRQLPYGPNYNAFVEPINFSYDADLSKMTFYPRNRDHFLQVDVRPDVQLVPMGDSLPDELSVSIAPQIAAKYRYSNFSLALIFTFSGLMPPVLSGPIEDDNLFNPPLPIMGDGEDQREQQAKFGDWFKQWQSASFSIHAHLVKAIVFDPSNGGAEKPILTWNASHF